MMWKILQSFCWMRFLDDFSVILKTWKLNLMLKFWMTIDENFLISVITLALSTTSKKKCFNWEDWCLDADMEFDKWAFIYTSRPRQL